ncbi:5162_t:CDS:2 [Paraglomus brasilianum]|uniref:5162_t:CDS:1 n=1 Tax=Paraglomus brasilianum TaxID=144538 RepID=A0A9N8WBF0_9GLOM|nr:5162_t:CDS:2 [Paraglomus brasilianum]
MEDFKKLPQDLQTQENLDRLLELEQKKLELEKLRLQQAGTTAPNWNNSGSVYNWMRRFDFNRGRNRLVKSFGKIFELCGRETTIGTLWDGDPILARNGVQDRFKCRKEGDKKLHPIPVLAGGPGTGKSRFLDEIEKMLLQRANSSNDEFKNAFKNMIVINTTYGNGSPADDIDMQLGALSSFVLCILFEYFRPQYKTGDNYTFTKFRGVCQIGDISKLTLDTALEVIYADIKEQVTTSNEAPGLLVVVIDIDEFNKLHALSKEACKKLINTIGGTLCASPPNIFLIPILAGTIEGPLEHYITESMHKSLRLPLPLLENKDAIKIGKAIKLDENYAHLNEYYQLCIGDIGEIMNAIKIQLLDDYKLTHYSNWLTKTLAKAILGLPVLKTDSINVGKEFTTYEELSSRGILNLVLYNTTSKEYQIQIPYIWTSALVRNSNEHEMIFWQEMLNYEEPMHWRQWEDFNAQFWALRLNLFCLAGNKKIKLKELLRGASISCSLPDVEVTLPETSQLCQLKHQYLKGKLY